jgi:penicillin-insensitive murein DD-endopeptidase
MAASQMRKEPFARKPEPVRLAARAIGNYVRGCLAAAVALPINGRTWQVMRLSRNRNWGHPELIRFLERLANKVPQVGWRGLLVSDLAQPRGGPTPYLVLLLLRWLYQSLEYQTMTQYP